MSSAWVRIQARMLMIGAGYEDSDDIDALRADPALKIAVGDTRWPAPRLPRQLPSGGHAHGDDGRHHGARPVNHAARAAGALLLNRQRVPGVPRSHRRRAGPSNARAFLFHDSRE